MNINIAIGQDVIRNLSQTEIDLFEMFLSTYILADYPIANGKVTQTSRKTSIIKVIDDPAKIVSMTVLRSSIETARAQAIAFNESNSNSVEEAFESLQKEFKNRSMLGASQVAKDMYTNEDYQVKYEPFIGTISIERGNWMFVISGDYTKKNVFSWSKGSIRSGESDLYGLILWSQPILRACAYYLTDIYAKMYERGELDCVVLLKICAFLLTFLGNNLVYRP